MNKLVHAALAGLAFVVLAGLPAATGDAATPPDVEDYAAAPVVTHSVEMAPSIRHPRMVASAQRGHARP